MAMLIKRSEGRRPWRRSALVGLLFALPPAAHAESQQDSEQDSELELAPLVIESAGAQANHRVGDVLRSEHTGSMSRYSGREMGRGASSVGEVLERGVGTEVRTIGAPGSYSTVSLRGADSDQVAVYLDGMLLNEAMGGGVNLAELELAHAQSIEVYRGISPVQFGYGVPGGTVNIRLPRPGDGRPWKVGGEYGSFGQQALSVLGQTSGAKWSVLGAATRRTADNDFELTDNIADRRRSFDGSRRRNADFEQNSGFIKVDRELHNRQRLAGFVRYFHKDQGLPRWDNRPSATRLETQVIQARGRWSNAGLYSTPWGVYGELFTSHKQDVYDDRGGNIGLGDQHNRYQTLATGVSGYAEYVGRINTLAMRADWRYEEFLGEDLLGYAPDSQAERNSLNAVLGNTAYLFDERLVVAVALRYKGVSDEGRVRSTGIGADFEQREITQSWTTPTLGVRFWLTDNLAFRVNAGEYVRSPNLDELFGDRGLVRGNPHLKAETGENLDLGFEWSRQWQRSWLPSMGVELAYFRNRVEDMIIRTFDSRGVGQSNNLAQAEIDGLEAAATTSLTHNLSVELRGTVTDSEQISEMLFADGKMLPGRFRYQYGAGVVYDPGEWEWYYGFDSKEEMYYDTANLLPAEDRVRHDLSVSRKMGGLKLSFSINNLTDEFYEDYRGHPRPGRSWHLSLSYGPERQAPSAKR